MKYTIGLFVASIGFYLASEHLKQGLTAYWDYVAFFVVIFGTLAVLVITKPAASMKNILFRFLHKFFIGSPNGKKAANQCWEVAQTRQMIPRPRFIEEQILNDGLELLSLGFKKETAIDILSQRYHHYENQMMLISAWFKRNAKYPPAFGLAGTVLGLIHLMRGISAGIDSKETGMRMAVALVATFYGLIISNLFLNPIGEWLIEEAKKDQHKAEMAIETVGLMFEQANSVETQERINSFLDPQERLSNLNLGEELGAPA
jgi:chemotaxis protein MotA